MDVPWLSAQNHQKSDLKKSDKADAEESFMASFSSPEMKIRPSVASHIWQSESEKQFTKSVKGKYEDANKSKVKVTKLMKTMKPENPKRIVKQNSKDSVVLVGYKCLKSGAPEDISKCFEGMPSCNQKEVLEFTGGEHACDPNNFIPQVSQKEIRGLPPRTVKLEDNEESQCASAITQCANSVIFSKSEIPQIGNEGIHGDSNLRPRSTVEDYYSSSGVRKIEVKPYCKNLYGGEKVFVRFGSQTDIPHGGAHRENVQEPTYNSSEFEKRRKSEEEEPLLETEVLQEADFQHSGDPLVKVKTLQFTLATKETHISVVTGDVLKPPDVSVTHASSRFSDSGVESEPSSFAMHLSTDVGFETPQGQSACNSERLFPQLLLKPDCNIKNPVESYYTESTSAVSEIQSSLTSINSLPSDDDLSPDENSKLSVAPERQLSDSKTVLDLGAIGLAKCDYTKEPNVLPHQCVGFYGHSDNETTLLPSSPSNIKGPFQLVSDEDTSADANSQTNIGTTYKDSQSRPRNVHTLEKANEIPSGIVYLGESCVVSGSVSSYTESGVKKPSESKPSEPSALKQIADELPTTKSENPTGMSIPLMSGSTDMLKQGLVENYFGYQSSTEVSNMYPPGNSNPVSPQRGSICSLPPEEDDEQDQDMVENGYYEEADDNNSDGVTKDSAGENLGLTNERTLRTERISTDFFRDGTNMAPLCAPSNLAFPSTLRGHPGSALWSSKDKPNAVIKQTGSMSRSPASSVSWYECSPKPQVLA